MASKIKRTGKFFVYILECKSKTYYTGSTKNLEKRIKEHSSSNRGARYLRGKSPLKLVYAKEYKYCKNALKAERRIKSLPRKRKEELIDIYERESRDR
jgi:putative endonuclease